MTLEQQIGVLETVFLDANNEFCRLLRGPDDPQSHYSDEDIDKARSKCNALHSALAALRAMQWQYDMDDPYINQYSLDVVVEVCVSAPGREPIIRTEIADGASWKRKRTADFGVYAWRRCQRPDPAPLPQGEGE